MKMKLSNLNYQRNSVSGEGFFSVISENLTDNKGRFLITFDANDKQLIDHTTCRVVNLDNLKLSWRGDNVACDLQKEFQRLMKKHETDNIYALKQVI